MTEIQFEKISTLSDTIGNYKIDSNGEVVAHDYIFKIGSEAMAMSKRITNYPTSRSKTLTSGKRNPVNDSLIIDEQETQFFDLKGKTYRSLGKSFWGNTVIEDWAIDTIDTTTSYRSILTLDGIDTLRLIIYDKNAQQDVYLHKEKKQGKWDYEEKQLTNYKNGKFTHYIRIVNGETISEYGPENSSFKKEEEKDYYPLPFSDQNYIDSCFVLLNDLEKSFSKNRNEKMLRVEYNAQYQKVPVSVELYSSSGLLFSRNNTYEKFQTFYVYEMYK